jgi:hypothetical protein
MAQLSYSSCRNIRRLKAMMREVSVKAKREKESGVERSDKQEGHNVEKIQKVNNRQHKV